MFYLGNYFSCLLLLCSAVFAKDLDSEIREILSSISVVSSRTIEIDGYPHAYNPSIIPYQDGYLLSFRIAGRLPPECGDWKRKDYSWIGLARLDREFNVLSEQLLPIISHRDEFSLTAEDARLILAGDQIFIFFNDLPQHAIKRGCAMYYSEIIADGAQFTIKNPTIALDYPKILSLEKNWSPFWLDGKMFLIYSDNPRTILELDLPTGICLEVAVEPQNWSWPWGAVRGGTPAEILDGQFVTFFHSSLTKQKRKVYFMGLYTFDPHSPFSITAHTFRPIGPIEIYAENARKTVLFPGGMVVEGNLIHVVCGKNDNQIALISFDKRKLLRELSPVPLDKLSTSKIGDSSHP